MFVIVLSQMSDFFTFLVARPTVSTYTVGLTLPAVTATMVSSSLQCDASEMIEFHNVGRPSVLLYAVWNIASGHTAKLNPRNIVPVFHNEQFITPVGRRTTHRTVRYILILSLVSERHDVYGYSIRPSVRPFSFGP